MTNNLFTKEIETLKKKQAEILEIKDTIKEIKNELTSIGNRAHQMEERISDTEDRKLEMMQREEKRDFSIVKNERTLQELSDSINDTLKKKQNNFSHLLKVIAFNILNECSYGQLDYLCF